MSQEESIQSSESEALHDASLRIDESSLSEDERDFARVMGFGADGQEGAASVDDSAPAATQCPPESPEASESDASAAAECDSSPATDSATVTESALASEPADQAHEDKAAGDQDAAPEDDCADPIAATQAEETEAAQSGSAASASADDDGTHAEDDDRADDEAGRWDEIHPRSSAEGIQDEIEARADAVLARGGAADDATPAGASGSPPSDTARATHALEQQVQTLEGQLAARTLELDRLRGAFQEEIASHAGELKSQEALQSELETLASERDQLIDELAAHSTELVGSRAQIERLTVSLRAARGALAPLPEGERALRAEVLGLRTRIDETLAQNAGHVRRIESLGTDLSVAHARIEDRQHEIDVLQEELAELSSRLEVREGELAEGLESRREAVALAGRLQAENEEIRSTQIALEETISARDLEIAAREEHLAVTKQGLHTRDLQLVELGDLLQTERIRAERLEADARRGELSESQMAEKLVRREARIVALTEILERVEEALGRRLMPPEGSHRSSGVSTGSPPEEDPAAS